MSNLAAVAAHFNPSGCELRERCLAEFAGRFLATGIPLYIVTAPDTAAPIWQKERLLNRAIRELPSSVDKVIWIDGDLLIDAESLPNWAMEVSAMLDRWPVVQPWTTADFLGIDGNKTNGPAGQENVASVPYSNHVFDSLEPAGNRVSSGLPPNGWPGFCCAARRDVLDAIGGLYEYDLSGPNDVLMSLAFYGDFDNFFLMRYNPEFKRHFQPWAMRAFEIVQGKVGFASAKLMHLWHGPFNERRYLERTVRLYQAGYDPARHVTTAADGLLTLTDDCPDEVRRLAAIH